MKRSKLFIVGAGGFATEVYSLIYDVNSLGEPLYEVQAFVDRKTSESIRLGPKVLPIISEETFFANLTESEPIAIALGIGNPGLSEKIMGQFLKHRAAHLFSFPNLIHPSFTGHREGIEFGKGNIVTAGCCFTINIKVGSFNIFNLNTTIGHEAVIGSFNVFNPGCNISGGVQIGDSNLFGTNSAILQGLKIGNATTVGASALVTKNLDEGKTYVGIPATQSKTRSGASND